MLLAVEDTLVVVLYAIRCADRPQHGRAGAGRGQVTGGIARGCQVDGSERQEGECESRKLHLDPSGSFLEMSVRVLSECCGCDFREYFEVS